jgi:hypothetical protein
VVGSSGSNQAGVIWVPRGYLAMFGDIFALVVITAGVATSMWCGESRADVVNMHQGTEQLLTAEGQQCRGGGVPIQTHPHLSGNACLFSVHPSLPLS